MPQCRHAEFSKNTGRPQVGQVKERTKTLQPRSTRVLSRRSLRATLPRMPRAHHAETGVVRPGAEQLRSRPDVQVALAAARSWSVLTTAELRRCGLTDDGIWVRVRNGRLHPLHRSVYAVGHANPPLEGCFLGAVKACGAGALLSRVAAASHRGWMSWDHRLPEVLVAGRDAPEHPGIRTFETAYLPPEDVTILAGIPITSPVRTLLDLAGMLGHKQLRRVVREAQARDHVDLAELARRLHGPGPTRGRARLRRIIATGPAPTRSQLEDTVLDLLLGGGIAHPRVNEPLWLGGRRVIPDFRWPEQRLVLEADGAAWHENPLAREDDAERQAILEAHGERVLRVTWKQAVGRGAETLRRVRAAGAPLDTGVALPEAEQLRSRRVAGLG